MKRSMTYLFTGLLCIAGLSNSLAQSFPVQLAGFAWTAKTKNSPAVATFGTTEYIAWTGTSSASQIWFSSYDGTAWSLQQVVSGTGWTAASEVAPALGADPSSGLLYLVWKAKGANTIFLSTWDGTSWTTPEQVSGSGWTAETTAAPARSVADLVAVAWKGNSSSGDIWFSIWNDPGWQDQQRVQGIIPAWTASSSVAPNFSNGGGGNYFTLFWKGKSTTDIYMSYLTASGWLPIVTVSCTKPAWTALTDAAPASSYLENTDDADAVFWKGKGASTIWYSYTTTSGCGWAPQATVKGTGWTAESNLAPAVGGNVTSASILAWTRSDNTIWYVDPTTLPGISKLVVDGSR
jgi:hypothetical protein